MPRARYSAWRPWPHSYSPAAGCQSDALSIDATIQSRHLPFGGILDPIFSTPSSQAITGYTRCGDSALWTGHYLAAESYRYQVSGDPAALANAQGALAYLKTLVDVTGTDVLARCIVPINSNSRRRDHQRGIG